MALRLIAVHAHPDDESSKGAATYAHYVEQGVEVLVVSCTGGERGDVLNELAARDPKSRRDLAGLRRGEMAKARDILGFEHRWLGYEDSGPPGEGVAVPQGCFADVPTEMLPVRLRTAFVETMPVPASPSGGAMSAPGCSLPVGSSSHAPSFVSWPPEWPARSGCGRISCSFQG